jgi:response regulator NasT
MRVAMERFETDQALRAELEDTRLRLTERQLVERAKGILMKHRGIDEEAAYSALRSLAMERGVRIGEVARQVIDVAGLLA